MSYETITLDGPEPHTPETLQKARLTVCHNATNTTDAAELLAMLGLDTG